MMGAGSAWSFPYQWLVRRLENTSYTSKLVSFELVFLGSRLALAGVAVLLQLQVERVIDLPEPFRFPFNLLALVPIGAGVVTDVWGIRTFLTSGFGTPAPTKPPQRLVVEGPYKYVRNPMYLSIFLTLLGFVVLFDVALLLLVALALLIAINFLVLPREETNLEARFGREYMEYKKRVSRWIPHFRSPYARS